MISLVILRHPPLKISKHITHIMKSRLLFAFLALILCSPVVAQNACTGVWGQYLVNQTFGQGNATNTWYGPLNTYALGASTSTIFVGATGPAGGVLTDNYSGLAKVPSASGQGNWVATTDHTGNPNGLMFLINAPSTAATVFFEYTMDNLCPNTMLKLSVWILNANVNSLTTNPTYQYPNMTLRAIDATTNVTLGSSESGNVPADEVWHQYSVIFNNGGSTSIKLQLVNNSVGSGFGNDLAVDDITVQPCVPASHILPKVNTTICQNTTLNFNADVTSSPYNPAEYQWQYSSDNGATWLDQGAAGPNTNYVFNTSNLAPGTYLVRFKTGPLGLTANYNCVAVSDTSIIHVAEFPRITLNESVCLGNVYDFFGHYVGLQGTYDTLVKLGPTDLCGTLYTLHLTVKMPPDVAIAGPAKIDICEGDTAKLLVLNPATGATYQWLKDGAPITGETSTLYQTTNTGFYKVSGVINGCADTSERITVTERALPEADILYESQSLCSYDTLNFLAEKQVEGTYYTWSPESAFRTISGSESQHVRGVFKENTMVYLKVYSPYGCSGIDSVMALVHPCCMVLLPTAFSPNNDGLNDYFNPVLDFGQKVLTLKVFDRYGKIVYNNSNLQKGWDGRYPNGEPAGQGIYMYRLQYTCGNEQLSEEKGDLTLIR